MQVNKDRNSLGTIVPSGLVEIHLDISALVSRWYINSLAHDSVLELLSTGDVETNPLDGTNERPKDGEERAEVYIPQAEGVASGRRHSWLVQRRSEQKPDYL